MIEIKVPQFKPHLDVDATLIEMKKVLSSGFITEGRVAHQLNDSLKELTGIKHLYFAPNGTLAIVLALQALGLGPGDEVLVPDITFIATANAVHMVGAHPRPVDIVSANNPTIDVTNIEIKENTRALMIAPLFGTAPTNLEQIIEFCNNNDLILIEDAAQCIGVKGSIGHMGSFGKISTFSFYADKTITMGEGGLVATNDDVIADRIVLLRNQGRRNSGTFIHETIGYNYRITDFQAALGITQLASLQSIGEKKRAILARYRNNLSELPQIKFLETRVDDFALFPFRCVVFTDKAETAIQIMESKGVQSRAMFYPVHRQPGYVAENWSKDSYPNSDECSRTGICLPTWVGMSADDIDYVSSTLREALEHSS